MCPDLYAVELHHQAQITPHEINKALQLCGAFLMDCFGAVPERLALIQSRDCLCQRLQ